MIELQNSYEGIKQKVETLIFDTNKLIKKAVSQSEFATRIVEVVSKDN